MAGAPELEGAPHVTAPHSPISPPSHPSAPEITDAFRALTSELFGRVIGSDPRTIAELSDGISASRPTVRRALDGLEAHSLIRTAGLRASDAGRPATQYQTGPGTPGVVGIDVRAFSTHITCTSTTGHILGRRDLTHEHADDDTRLDQALLSVETLMEDALEVAGPGRLHAVVLGVPGIVGPTGTIRLSRIIPSWTDLALAEIVAARFPSAQVRVENDMNLRALAAKHDGSAQGLDDFVYLTDNGHLRPAVVLDGRLRRGAHLTLGEDNSFTHVGLVPKTLRHDGQEVEFRRIALGLEDGTLAADWLPVLQGAPVDILLAIRYLLDPQAFIIDGPPATTGPAELESLRQRLAERTTIGDAPLILTDGRGQDATLHGALTLALRDALTATLQVSDPPIPRIHEGPPLAA